MDSILIYVISAVSKRLFISDKIIRHITDILILKKQTTKCNYLDRIIAMSFPSKGRDAFFRNDIVVSDKLVIRTRSCSHFFPNIERVMIFLFGCRALFSCSSFHFDDIINQRTREIFLLRMLAIIWI